MGLLERPVVSHETLAHQLRKRPEGHKFSGTEGAIFDVRPGDLSSSPTHITSV